MSRFLMWVAVVILVLPWCSEMRAAEGTGAGERLVREVQATLAELKEIRVTTRGETRASGCGEDPPVLTVNAKDLGPGPGGRAAMMRAAAEYWFLCRQPAGAAQLGREEAWNAALVVENWYRAQHGLPPSTAWGREAGHSRWYGRDVFGELRDHESEPFRELLSGLYARRPDLGRMLDDLLRQ